MYSATITSIGEDAIFEDSGMLVLFSPGCPDELKDVCLIHESDTPPEAEALRVGGTLTIDGRDYAITHVGSVANENFSRLGHVTLMFGSAEDALPGAIVLSPADMPQVAVGTTIAFT